MRGPWGLHGMVAKELYQVTSLYKKKSNSEFISEDLGQSLLRPLVSLVHLFLGPALFFVNGVQVTC